MLTEFHDAGMKSITSHVMAAPWPARYRGSMSAGAPQVGGLLREWRKRRHLSQLELALETEISTRHLSFLETGRSAPSREMVLRLADQLEVPMRERNVLLVAAGYAPKYSEHPLGDAALEDARRAIDLMLEAQKPFPAFAIGRDWMILATNGALPEIYADIPPFLLEPPVNALRLALHPEGVARRIVNLAEWRGYLLARLQRQIQTSPDPPLVKLMRELSQYPPYGEAPRTGENPIAIPIRIQLPAGLLSFLSLTTVFGTPSDITLAELALEFFLPADLITANAVRTLAG
jgi:transcriptional regulator with XRE-family HTH domain